MGPQRGGRPHDYLNFIVRKKAYVSTFFRALRQLFRDLTARGVSTPRYLFGWRLTQTSQNNVSTILPGDWQGRGRVPQYGQLRSIRLLTESDELPRA